MPRRSHLVTLPLMSGILDPDSGEPVDPDQMDHPDTTPDEEEAESEGGEAG